MRALVIGGTGFVGANLVAALSVRGITTRVLHRKTSSLAALTGLRYETAIGDILASPNALAKVMTDCDWVFHTAAVTQYWRLDQDVLYQVNVEGTKNVVAAAKMSQVDRLIFTSSLAAMGLPKNGELLDEFSQFNLKPREFPYGHSKHLAELEVQRAAEEGLATVIVNPTAIVGSRDINQLSGSIILEAAKGHMLVNLPGGLNFVAVEDVVSGHLAAAERGRTGERYILAGENLSYRTAVAIICEIIGRRAPSVGLPVWLIPAATGAVAVARLVAGSRVPISPTQVRMSAVRIFANGSKAIQELGLGKTTPFKCAVQRAYDWYRSNGYI